MVELVKYMVSALVDSKDDVEVSEDGEVIHVKVAKDDIGKVIGKQGRIIKAIRSVVKSASAKLDKNYSVEVDE